ncbi:MAG TPA: bifunctional diguanylate cyclase/phosphodiesterase [Pseudonocardia sp.]|nr:bifunctional diguanylate cyclase/phosphodiesterase [Pseudonocardia sp.]
MIAACSLPEPDHPGPDAAVAALAARWAEVVIGAAPAGVARLTTLLRRLAAVLRAEPFWPLAAREIGRELLAAGPATPDVLPASLGLLRVAAPDALDLVGVEGRRRLDAALDELAAGFAGALRQQTRIRAATSDVPEPAGDAEALYRSVYLQGPAGLAIAGLDGQVHDLNPVLCRMFGLATLDQPRPLSDFVHPDDRPAVLARYRSLVSGELGDETRLDMRLVRPDGLVLWTHVIASLVHDGTGAPTHVIAVVENLSDRYRLPTEPQSAASTDQLTRLPNRARTEQWLQRSFAGRAARMGFCALDIDRFADVNDALGHQAGDQLLLAVAARLQMVAGEHLVTRTGGDEFAVVVTDPDGVCAVSHVADRVLAALATPFVVAGHALTVSASIGVAAAPTDDSCPAELMRAADVALSWAKAKGGGRRVVFDPERDAGESARFALLAGLRAGIDRSEFRLVYQPLIRLADRATVGAEALVRWQHPTQGLLGPGRFIEPAERTGAIVALGRWVLEQACRQAATWRAELGDAAPYVSVNVSPVQLCEPGWVRLVASVLADTGLPADRLQLEITEQAVLADETVALDALTALREAGVRLALDDFGTGYSSLAWLRRLPVHALKIDGSFIDGLRHVEPDAVDASIVRALVQLAHALDLEVTAEWVESEVQARRLAELGCDLAQGRWFGDAGPGEWVTAPGRRSIRT